MRDDSPQWEEVGPPATPNENEALQAIKKMLPDGAIAWAWSNISFIGVNGRLAETDLLLLTQTGFTLIELKGWHGKITGGQRNWMHNSTPKQNPLFSTDLKAKWLRELLNYVQPGPRKVPIPYIRAITVLHGRDCDVQLDSVATTDTYGLDGFNVKGVPLFSEYLAKPLTDIANQVDLTHSKKLVLVVKLAGFSVPLRARKVGQYTVDQLELIEQGPTWSDVLAENPHLHGQKKRIRLYDVPLGASAERRQQLTRIAQREYFLTSGLSHPGVTAPQEFFDDPQTGPALIFAHEPNAIRLDRWLALNQDSLTIERRLEVLRNLAEILRYAHLRQVSHRALSPQQVFIHERVGASIRVSVRDWQTGREEPGLDRGTTTPAPTVLLGTRNLAGSSDVQTWVYLAPEIHTAEEPDGVALDVYGLGSVGYLIITGNPPAENIGELEQRIRGSQGLDPGLELDELPEGLRQLIQRATHPDARIDRTPSVEAFLADLDAAERELNKNSAPENIVDPLEAQAESVLDDRFMVLERLGSGSTGLALLVTDLTTESVLKVAHDGTKEARLAGEYEILNRLDHPRIVKPLEPPLTLGGHLALNLEDAGRPTLGSRIRSEGRLSLDMLERYGADLLEVADYLDQQGILHRDIKPDNLGVRTGSERKQRLVLFDFSLADEPLEHVKAGTPPYLDPFLGAGRRPRYDRAAERFAVAVTLFEMATGTKPVWGSGDADPATITEEVTLGADLFEAAVSASMTAFFRKALARESTERFGDLAELAQAWSSLFTAADSITQTLNDETTITEPIKVELSTPLNQAGLSARAMSALARLAGDETIETVGELLAIQPQRVNFISGVGDKTRREIQHRMRDWRRELTVETSIIETVISASLHRSLDAIALSLMPKTTTKNVTEIALASAVIGLNSEQLGEDSWPNLTQLAERLGVSRGRVSQVFEKLRTHWNQVSATTGLSDEVFAIIDNLGGFVEASEIARALLATQGSTASEPQRTRQAMGVVRAIVEADSAQGGDSRFASRRFGSRMILALEPLDPEGLPADLTLDWIKQVAEVADKLAAQQPIAVQATALHELRSITPPKNLKAIPMDRLTRIAAAASKTAAVGTRGEIYPRGLKAQEALRLTLAGISASRTQLTPETLANRVTGRFPEAEPLPPRPALDRLVSAVNPKLTWNGTAFVAPTDTSHSVLSTQHGLTVFGPASQAQPFDLINTRLAASLDSAGYLTLAVNPRHQDQVAKAITERHNVTVINLTTTLINAMKDTAKKSNVDWTLVLSADSKDTASQDWGNLNRLVTEAMNSVLPEILAKPEPILFTDPAPLGRYHQYKWLAELADLSTTRPAARWLLVPHRDSAGPPTLDSHIAVPLGADGYLTIGSNYFEQQHSPKENAS